MVISRLAVIVVLRLDGCEESIIRYPMMRKIVTRSAYGIGAVVVLVVAAALILPEFLDTPAVERELQAKLSQAAHAEIAWEKLSIRLLPSPRGALSGVRVEIPGLVSVRAEQVDAHLRLLPLFRGRAEIASVSLTKPSIRLDVSRSPPSEKKDEAQADLLESYRAAVDAIRSFAPEAALDIEDADLDLRISGLPSSSPKRSR